MPIRVQDLPLPAGFRGNCSVRRRSPDANGPFMITRIFESGTPSFLRCSPVKFETPMRQASFRAKATYRHLLDRDKLTLLCSIKIEVLLPSQGYRNAACRELVKIIKSGWKVRTVRQNFAQRMGIRTNASIVQSIGFNASFFEKVPSGSLVSGIPSRDNLRLNSPSDQVLVTALTGCPLSLNPSNIFRVIVSAPKRRQELHMHRILISFASSGSLTGPNLGLS